MARHSQTLAELVEVTRQHTQQPVLHSQTIAELREAQQQTQWMVGGRLSQGFLHFRRLPAEESSEEAAEA